MEFVNSLEEKEIQNLLLEAACQLHQDNPDLEKTQRFILTWQEFLKECAKRKRNPAHLGVEELRDILLQAKRISGDAYAHLGMSYLYLINGWKWPFAEISRKDILARLAPRRYEARTRRERNLTIGKTRYQFTWYGTGIPQVKRIFSRSIL